MQNKTEILRGNKMSRKFSIIKTIDLEKIDDEIQRYKMLYQRDDPYFFMSEDTARAIECELNLGNIVINNDSLINKIKNTKGGVYATYSGHQVFINNNLKFGIVEIR